MKKILVITCLQFLSFQLLSQVVINESFDGAAFPPFGWTSQLIKNGSDPNNFTERVTVGNAPACNPHSGAGMLRYRSGSMFNAGEKCFLASPRFDLTNNPGTATVSFWLYRDNFNFIQDSLTVYINDSADANTSYASMTLVGGPVTRSGGANSWVQYTYTIPAGYNNSSAYIIFVFTNRETSGAGANMYFDSFSITTWPKPMTLVSSALSFQATNPVGKNQANQLVVGIKVITDGAGSPINVDSINFNANGSSAPSIDIVPGTAKLWYTKGTNSFILNGNQFGLGINPAFSTMKFTQAAFKLENGDNYFWLTYTTTISAVNGNFIDADFAGINTNTPIVTTLPGGRPIEASLCNGVIPTLIVGTSHSNYNQNDYINRVYLRGENAFAPTYPFIDNAVNTQGPFGLTYSTPFTAHPPDYELFPEVSSSPTQPHTTAVLLQGANYTPPVLVAGNPVGQGLAIQCGTWPSSNYVAAWIDFNRDGDLLDPGEQIIGSTGLAALGWAVTPVIVPSAPGSSTANINTAAANPGIVFGNTRLRVREVYANANIQPCQSGYTFGETEDFTVSLLPASCAPGFKLWLGYTDNWNSASNWCGGVPTINDIAVIDEATYLGAAGAAYEPVIHSGTVAAAKTIRIGASDSLLIDASSNSSLQIADSLVISYNTPAGGNGFMKVNSTLSDTAQHANGNLIFNITPFMASRKQARTQLVYTKNELLLKGMIAGDVVDQLIFHLRATPGVSHNFNNLTIKYANCDSTWGKWTIPPTQLAPNTSAYVTVYGPTTTTINLPANGGTVTLNLLSNKFIWNGVSDLVLDICYDNAIVVAQPTNDLPCQTQTTGYYQTMWINTSGVSPAGCTLGNTGFPVVSPAVAVASQYRPNITFHFKRPYTKFPINITGNGNSTHGRWVNNGTFVHGYSNVTFSNASINQGIGGSSVTTFNDLTVNKGASTSLKLTTNAMVDSFLVLNSGFLELNRKMLTINNPMTTAIQRTAPGCILSENPPPGLYGTVSKKVSTTLGAHIIPFGKASGAYIPFVFQLTAGDPGYVTVSTYATAADNTPYASDGTMGGTVLNMNDYYTQTDLSVQNVVDRFWKINKSGPSGTANVLFSFTTSERPTLAGLADNTLKAQRWENPNINGDPGWSQLLNTFAHTASANTVNMLGLTTFDGPWALCNILSPMGAPCNQPPVISFSASATSICKNDSALLTANGANNYTWAPAAGLSATTGNQVYAKPTVTTTYTLTGFLYPGCSTTKSKKITVLNIPALTVTPSAPTICPGGSKQITASGSTGTYAWLPAAGLNTTTGPVVLATPASTTTYTVTGTNANGCTAAKTSKVTVKCPVPNGLIAGNITGTTADLTWNLVSCAIGYKLEYRVTGTTNWTVIQINTNTAAYQLTGLSLSTSYEWKVVTKCGPGVISAYSSFSGFTTAPLRSNNEPAAGNRDVLTVHPNPVAEFMHLAYAAASDGHALLTIQNAMGQVIYSKDIIITDGLYEDEISTSLFATGIYLVKVEQAGSIRFVKIVKE